ncbi:MAG: C45 family autoproteolytic acyltransferase/hydrolase [Nannocystaceae bacterium]
MGTRARLRVGVIVGLLASACSSRGSADVAVVVERSQPPPADVRSDADDRPTPRVAATSSIHGALRTIDGQRVLHVWGTPREMGRAHGALLRDPILAVIDGYVLAAIPPATFTAAGPLYATQADIAAALREEAEGVIEGMREAGGALVPGLGRELTVADLLLMNAITDLVAVGCSSVSAWGEATAADEALGGELAIVRNLDWSDSAPLLGAQVIIAYEPSDPGSQRLVSVAFAGYLGCLSCVNEAGVAAFFNMGHGEGAASRAEAARGFAPANLLLRTALSARDLDGDGESTGDDVARALAERRHAGSYIVHVVEPRARASAAGRAPARILEVEASGVGERRASAELRLGESVLAATNHLRELAPPRLCSRYRRIERAIDEADHAVTSASLWSLGESVRLEDEVVHTLLVVPSARRIGVRMRAVGQTMDRSPPRVDHEWSTLFAGRG